MIPLISQEAGRFGLTLLGTVSLQESYQDCTGIALLGPAPGFWDIFSNSAEHKDTAPDALDRWTTRTGAALAQTLDATAIYPFGGPPYAPFLSWAAQSGAAWPSEVGMLIHKDHGLMVSYRLALGFTVAFPAATPSTRPCDTCTAKPCLTACPVGALGKDGYDVPKCKAHLAAPAGTDCLSGCNVRRSCPVSAGADRLPEQSAFHMRAFLGSL